MQSLNERERIELRLSIPEKMRFPRDAILVTPSAIAKKWGVSVAHAIRLISEKYEMSRIDVSSSPERRCIRVDVDDYYRATRENFTSEKEKK